MTPAHPTGRLPPPNGHRPKRFMLMCLFLSRNFTMTETPLALQSNKKDNFGWALFNRSGFGQRRGNPDGAFWRTVLLSRTGDSFGRKRRQQQTSILLNKGWLLRHLITTRTKRMTGLQFRTHSLPKASFGRAIFIQCRCWEKLHSIYEVDKASPVLDKNPAPMGPEILSSTGAGVWRKAPKAFPDSSSVLDKFQSANFEKLAHSWHLKGKF